MTLMKIFSYAMADKYPALRNGRGMSMVSLSSYLRVCSDCGSCFAPYTLASEHPQKLVILATLGLLGNVVLKDLYNTLKPIQAILPRDAGLFSRGRTRPQAFIATALRVNTPPSENASPSTLPLLCNLWLDFPERRPNPTNVIILYYPLRTILHLLQFITTRRCNSLARVLIPLNILEFHTNRLM